MKYIVTWPSRSAWGDECNSEFATSKKEISQIIENWIDEQELDISDFQVFELGNEISVERKVVIKETSQVTVR